MTILQASTKIDLRLNKGSSSDYDNLWSYVKQEAFNKAVNEWIRRQKRGKNQTREGDEETADRVDDLQVLLKRDTISFRDKGIYYETNKLPADYLYFKRLTPYATKGSCSNILMKSYLKEEANVDDLLHIPSFKFEETFHTLIGNKAHIYHNNDFSIDKVVLTYYRKPKVYDFKKVNDIIEFKDDICELLVDEAAKIIASDIESLNQKALNEQRTEFNN